MKTPFFMLKTRKSSVRLRTICLILLLAFTPFAVIGLYNEGKDYAAFTFAAVIFLIFIDLYLKTFLKPLSASFEDDEIVARYYTGSTQIVYLNDINGYSNTEELTRYGNKKGIIIYLKGGKHLGFTEINIENVSPLTNYLITNNIYNCGSETVRPWFFPKYKYDSLFSN